MKVINSSEISSFGGLNFVIEELDKLGMEGLLKNHLPALPSQCSYEWRDIIYSFWSVLFCGGDCAEDLSYNLKNSLKKSPLFKVPSPDRVLNRMKELACESIEYTTERGKSLHTFNHNDKLNLLNIRFLNKIKVFDTNEDITIDYDNTTTISNKKDAQYTYKREKGYIPGVATFGKNVVYVENRNGNSDAQTLQNETLQRMFNLLTSEGIKVNKFRADSAAYQLTTISVIDQNVDEFYVKTRNSAPLEEAVSKITKWTKGCQEDEGALFYGEVESFTPFQNRAKVSQREHLLKPYRLVVKKIKRRDGQLNILTQEPYNYQIIITNDRKSTPKDVFDFYNQRGKSEIEFDVLKNDFGWKKLPFSKMEENTVYLIITAMCKNIYDYIIKLFSAKYEGLSKEFRIKKFIYRFISIPAKWVYQGRQWILRVYGEIRQKEMAI